MSAKMAHDNGITLHGTNINIHLLAPVKQGQDNYDSLERSIPKYLVHQTNHYMIRNANPHGKPRIAYQDLAGLRVVETLDELNAIPSGCH